MAFRNNDKRDLYLDVSPSSTVKCSRGHLYKACRNYFTAITFKANLEKQYGETEYTWIIDYPSETDLFKNLLELYTLWLNGSEPEYSSFCRLIAMQPSFVPRSASAINFVKQDCDFVASIANRPDAEPCIVEILPSACETELDDYEPLRNQINEESVIEKLIDDPPAFTLYAPPCSGKTTFLNHYNSRLCPSCYEEGTMYRHWNAFQDTDDIARWKRPPCFIVSNIPGALSVAEFGVALICSRDEFERRCRFRGLDYRDSWFDDVIRLACGYPHSYGGYVGVENRTWKKAVPRSILDGVPDPSNFGLSTSSRLLAYVASLEPRMQVNEE